MRFVARVRNEFRRSPIGFIGAVVALSSPFLILIRNISNDATPNVAMWRDILIVLGFGYGVAYILARLPFKTLAMRRSAKAAGLIAFAFIVGPAYGRLVVLYVHNSPSDAVEEVILYYHLGATIVIYGVYHSVFQEVQEWHQFVPPQSEKYSDPMGPFFPFSILLLLAILTDFASAALGDAKSQKFSVQQDPETQFIVWS